MGKNNFRVSVNLILKKGQRVLLMRRFNTGWNDGKYALMGGHVEDNENPVDAVLREAKEELGLTLRAENLTYKMTMPVYPDHIYIYFECENFDGTPVNNEPNECDDIQFFDIDSIPKNIIEADKQALKDIYAKLSTFDTFGYQK